MTIGTLSEDLLLPLQDHGFFKRRAVLLQRAVPFGVRVTNRLVRRGQLGHYVADRMTWGDVIGPYHWPPSPGGGVAQQLAAVPGASPLNVAMREIGQSLVSFARDRGAWSPAWPAIVQGGSTAGTDATATRQGLGSVGVAARDAVRRIGAGIQAAGRGAVAGVQGAFRGWTGAKGGYGATAGAKGFGGDGGVGASFGRRGGKGSGPGRGGGASTGATAITGEAITAREEVSLLPIWSDAWDPDRRFQSQVARLSDDRRLPSGTVGIVLDSVRETKQDTLFFPADSKLIAVNYAGDPAGASLVYDLDAQDRPDPARRARLHSTFRVVRPDPKSARTKAVAWTANAIAWQLGRAGQDALEGLGLCADHTERAQGGIDRQDDGSGAEQTVVEFPPPGRAQDTVPILPATSRVILAAFGASAAGPLEVGDRNDQHRLGTTLDGEPILSGHLQTASLWRGAGGDGPLEFQARAYSHPRRLPFRTRVHLRWDEARPHKWLGEDKKGTWRWESETFFAFPPRIPITVPPPPWRPPPVIVTPPVRPPPEPPIRTPVGKGIVITTPPGPLRADFSRQMHRRQQGEPPESPLHGITITAGPGFAAQPAHPFAVGHGGLPDLRGWGDWTDGYDHEVLTDWVDWRMSRTPITGRVEAFGRVDAQGLPVYTFRPGTPGARYVGGTGPGGWVVMPPERGIEDYGTILPGSRFGSESETCWVFAPGTELAFGEPAPTTGCTTAGWGVRIGGTDATVNALVVEPDVGNTEPLVLGRRGVTGGAAGIDGLLRAATGPTGAVFATSGQNLTLQGGDGVVGGAAGRVQLDARSSDSVELLNVTTAGAAGASQGYIQLYVNGTLRKIQFFAV